MISRTTPLLVATILFGVAAGVSRGRAAAEGEYLCHRASPVRVDRRAETAVSVHDRFGERSLEPGRAALLCNGVSTGIGTQVVYRASVRSGMPRKARRIGARLELRTTLGTSRLRVRRASQLAYAEAAPGGTAEGTAPSTCYAVRAKGGVGGRVVVVRDERGEHAVRIKRPRRLCIDPDGGERLCHAIRALDRAERRGHEVVEVMTALGPQRLRVRGPAQLCVPVIGEGPPPPNPGFFLRISPTTLSVTAGEQAKFAARVFFEAGGSEDWSDRVTWTSADETIAKSDGSAGGGFIDAVGPGSTIISVLDPDTGVTSTDGNGDATLTVVWPLEKLTISPPAVRKPVGGSEEYTVTGHFAGGTTMNLTQRVSYRSSRPAVVSAPNTAGRRSLVHALAPGIALVDATDPVSGRSTADFGNTAVLRVAGGAAGLQIDPARRTRLVLDAGAVHQFTAVAYFADGTSKNVTQECEWTSTDETIVRYAPMGAQGSRFEAAAPGNAQVFCRHADASVPASSDVDVVTGELVGLELRGGPWPPLREGRPRSLTALGTFAPFAPNGSLLGTRNVTQDVVYFSRDPAVAIATNEPGNRSRLVGVAPGVARIYAEDQASGVRSADHEVWSFGRLIGIELRGGPWKDVLLKGASFRWGVRALYEGGALDLVRFDAGSTVLETADPAVVAVSEDGQSVIGIDAGRTTVWARLLARDLVSAPVELTVKGDLARLDMTPERVVRAIGEVETFTVRGFSPPEFWDLLTQQLVYHSSDPSVAIAANEPGRRSQVRAVGAGTTIISATDPGTGVSTSDSDDDAVIEVLPGLIERVTIQPADRVMARGDVGAFTAIGHWSDGRSINVTPQAAWTAIDPRVAEIVGAGPKLRAVGPGTTRIVAIHPSGVSSADSADDATLVVRELSGITLTPADRSAPVGTSVRYTVVGTFPDGSEINLTQDASYWVEPWGPAVAMNDDDDRSRLDLIEPATVAVHASAFGHRATTRLTITP